MITTPLAPIVAFLRKHGASLACLEGAPMGARCDEHIAQARLLYIQGSGEPGIGVLYLGTGPLCPAALGWASEVLAHARGWTGVDREDAQVYIDDDGALCLRGWNVCHEWQWKPADPSLWDDDVDADLITAMPSLMPSTPAARLKAMIEYEVSR